MPRAARSPAPLTPHGAAVSRLRAPCQTRARYLTSAKGHRASPVRPDWGEPGAGGLGAAVSPEVPPERPRLMGFMQRWREMKAEERRLRSPCTERAWKQPPRAAAAGGAERCDGPQGREGSAAWGWEGAHRPPAAPQQCRARSALLRTPVCLLLPPFAQPSGLGSARRVRSLESGELPAGSARLGATRLNSARLRCPGPGCRRLWVERGGSRSLSHLEAPPARPIDAA